MNCQLQVEKQWVREMPEHGQWRHQETDEEYRVTGTTLTGSTRYLVSMWKGHVTWSGGLTQAGWPSVSRDDRALPAPGSGVLRGTKDKKPSPRGSGNSISEATDVQ